MRYSNILSNYFNLLNFFRSLCPMDPNEPFCKNGVHVTFQRLTDAVWKLLTPSEVMLYPSPIVVLLLHWILQYKSIPEVSISENFPGTRYPSVPTIFPVPGTKRYPNFQNFDGYRPLSILYIFRKLIQYAVFHANWLLSSNLRNRCRWEKRISSKRTVCPVKERSDFLKPSLYSERKEYHFA